MPTLPNAAYPCTQQELYSCADTIYANALAEIAALAAYKAKYTVPFLDGLKTNVVTAKNLPDEEMRNTVSETLRLELIPLNNTCCNNFQLLKGYINDSYAKNFHETKYEAAGSTKYQNAAHYNWENTVGLNTAMKNFIAAEAATLAVNLAGDPNMPPTFLTKVKNDSDAFDAKYNAFKLARESSSETAAKINANNSVYSELISVCDDGQRVFSSDEAKKKLFTFAVVKNIISPPGSASLKVTIKRQADNTPVSFAQVTIKSAAGIPITLQTDVAGVAVFHNIDPADYNGTVNPPAPLNPKDFIKEVNTGTNARSDVFVS